MSPCSSTVLTTAKSEPQMRGVTSAPTSVLGRRRRKPQTPATVRRNERERNRVRHVNSCFARLRQFVAAVGPNGMRRHQMASNKRLSKVDTLRAAISYIRQLQSMLHQDDRFAPQNYPQVTIVDLEPTPKRQKSSLKPIKEVHFSSEDDHDEDNQSSNSSCSDVGASVGTSVGIGMFPAPGALSPCTSSNFSAGSSSYGSKTSPMYPSSANGQLSAPPYLPQQKQSYCAYSPPVQQCLNYYSTSPACSSNSPPTTSATSYFQGVPLQYAVYPLQTQADQQSSYYHWPQHTANYCR